MPMAARPRVLVLDPLHDDALADLRAAVDVVVCLKVDPAELPELVSGFDGVVVRSGVRLPAAVFERARRLRVVVRAGAGTDNIDLEAARRAGVQVGTVPGVSGGAVAELAIGLTLAVTRKIALADRQVRADLWCKPQLAGPQLAGRTMGLVGYGNIGSRVAEIASAFGMRVVASVSRDTAVRRAELAGHGVTLAPLGQLLAQADVVCVAVPLTAPTRGLIGVAELAAMKPSAYLVNVSRGGVVDEDALVAALRAGTVAGAALDVHLREGEPSPFAGFDNVVLTPHIGAMSVDAQRAVGQRAVQSILAALNGDPVTARVC